MTLGLYGGTFDPPHRGHVELVRRAKQELGIDRLIVVVAAAPGHKHVGTPAGTRLRLAQAAFPGDEVVLDDHARTVDTLRAHPEWAAPIFLVGADQFCDFPDWKEPNEVLRLARVGVATRPGFPTDRLQGALDRLDSPDRVVFFELEPIPLASSDLRARLAAGQPPGADIPSGAASIIEAEGLYRT